MQLTLEIPDHCLSALQDIENLSKQLKLYGALLMFQSGQLSRGAACEFADVDIYTFLAACKRYQISVTNIDADSIEADVLRFERHHPA